MSRFADSGEYDTQNRATRAETAYIKGLGMHAVDMKKTAEHRPRRAPIPRLTLLLNYQKTLDWGPERKDWGKVDLDTMRVVVGIEIADELKARPAFIPCDGHGVDVGARQYARRPSGKTAIPYLDPEEDMA